MAGGKERKARAGALLDQAQSFLDGMRDQAQSLLDGMRELVNMPSSDSERTDTVVPAPVRKPGGTYDLADRGDSLKPPALTGCTLVREMDAPLASPSVILVPRVAGLSEGSALVKGAHLGRLLGAGMQARVFELVHQDGRPTGKVVKIAHTDLGHRTLNAVWISMEREWEVGLKLRVALQRPDGQLPGYMRVCDALVSADDGGKGGGGGKRHAARFAGMVVEKLNGWEVYKRIEHPEFHNIHYVQEMLRQVFTALDRAQRETGFFHADMGMRNVMEHYPELYDEEQVDQPDHSLRRAGSSRGGSSRSDAEHYETSPGALPAAAPAGKARATAPGGDCTPLGPRLEFRIIDFGSSFFSEELAQATGGVRARENYRRLTRLFEGAEVAFWSPAKSTKIQLQRAELTPRDADRDQGWHLPTNLCQRFRLKSNPANLEAGGASGQGHPDAERLHIYNLERPGEVVSAARAPRQLHASSRAAVEPAGAARPPPPSPKTGPIERMYRRFWRRKGDVFHLLLDLSIALDDRVWPCEDRDDVMLFVSLVHHVTGVKMLASFASEAEPAAATLWGRLARVTRLRGKPERYGNKAEWWAWFRRNHIRFKANRLGDLPHAAPLASVFPRSL